MKKAIIIFFFFFFIQSSLAHGGDLDDNGCYFTDNNKEYQCHRNFIDPILKKNDLDIFDVNDIKDNSYIGGYANKYIKDNNTCKGITNVLKDFSFRVKESEDLYLYNLKKIEKDMIIRYISYLKELKGFPGLEPLNYIKNKTNEVKEDYLDKKDKYENVKVKRSDLEGLGFLDIESAMKRKANGYKINNYEYRTFLEDLNEASLKYQKYLYILEEIDSNYIELSKFLEDKCDNEYKKIEEKEISKKMDEAEQKIKEQEKKIKEYEEKVKQKMQKLQKKFNKIERIIPILHKKYPKKIFELVPRIRIIKSKISKDSEKYLLLDFIEKKIIELKD